MSIKIEKGIPVPESNSCIGRNRIYPWVEMEVGDSFVYPQGKAKNRAWAAAYAASKRYGKKFTARTMEDGSYRIWRIS